MKKTPFVKIVAVSFGVLFLAAGLGCSRLSVTGGGTEDVNTKTIAGVIVTSDGKCASETTVRLFPSRYNPVTDSLLSDKYIDTTDEKGAYRFFKIDTGTYSLQAVQNHDRTRALIENVHVSRDTIVATDTLHIPGKIKIMLPDSVDRQTGYVYIPGTDIKSLIRSDSGFAEVDSVPAGIVSAFYYGAKDITPYGICFNISVCSGDSVTFSHGPWALSMKLYLNTSPSGANITGNVYGFPVLIRLTSTIFDFSQAKHNGEDVRFLKSDNSPLHYEIEGWDSAQGQAQLWVSVDTILGNNSTQYITMCWGNPRAAAGSNGAAVFDTSNNFSGVWHLNENPGSGSSSIKDRTANKNDASSGGGMNYLNSVEGIIGNAIHFDGIGDNLKVKRPVEDDFTIEFWMKADSSSFSGSQWWQGNGLVDGDVQTAEPQNDFGVTYLNNKPVFGTCCSDTTLQADVTVNDAQWHYVVATRLKSSGVKTIFVDGKEAGSQVGTTNSLTGPDSLCFGRVLANITYFKGYLDEIQISKSVRSSEWILLCYMNRKDKDALVMVKP